MQSYPGKFGHPPAEVTEQTASLLRRSPSEPMEASDANR